MSYTCYLISNCADALIEIQESCSPQKLQWHDGTNAPSFSALVNTCVEKCLTETVIMMSHRVRPTAQHIQKLLQLLDQGHAFVGLYRFGFFGFRKQLFRAIGGLDERYTGGGYEDDDFYLRLREANLAFYLTHEVPYTSGPSTWSESGRELCRQHFVSKWGDKVVAQNLAQRYMPELPVKYQWGHAVPCRWMTTDRSVITPRGVKRYLSTQITHR